MISMDQRKENSDLSPGVVDDTPQFPATRPWADYPHITIESLLERYPDDLLGWESDREELRSHLLDQFEDIEFLLVEGDATVSPERLEELDDLGMHVVFTGSLVTHGPLKAVAFVAGDLYCDQISLLIRNK